jgi:hypothetical protein
LEGGLRSLWHTVLPDAAHVRTAYTLDSSTQQIVYVTGPALAIATAPFSPAAALALAAAVTVTGTVVFATARPARTWHAAAPGPQDRSGVLRTPAMRAVLLTLVCLGIAVGALDVAAIAVADIAVADRHEASWLAGALPAVFSGAGLAGGVLFARFQPATAPQPRHLLVLGAAPAGNRTAPDPAGPGPGRQGVRLPQEPCLPAQTWYPMHHPEQGRPGRAPQEARLERRSAPEVRPGRLQGAPRGRVRDQQAHEAPRGGHEI